MKANNTKPIELEDLYFLYDDDKIASAYDAMGFDKEHLIPKCPNHDVNYIYEHGRLYCPIEGCFAHQHWIYEEIMNYLKLMKEE